jgi:phenylpropionate dioxygenase-like ring-hydroxylating dioxygenase large terminal subunit
MAVTQKPLRPGESRSSGPSAQEIIANDAIQPPDTLRLDHYDYLGSDDIPVERYYSKEWHDLEVEHVWKRVWQLACREEEVPEVGDTAVYEVADLSILVVRASPTELKAYHNACLHRGTQLRAKGGYVPELRCPFHGWTWNLDGTLKTLSCEWDFSHVDASRLSLPEVQVDTWGGWVFVNPDPAAIPLAEYLGSFTEHFVWDTTKRFKSAHVSKLLRCNWKTCTEAFMESYHVIATHPQILLTLGDANTQYDVFPGSGPGRPGWNRMITAGAVASPHLGDVSEDDILTAMVSQYGMQGAMTVPDGQTARSVLANMTRMMMQGKVPPSFDRPQLSDSEALDAILYFVFPNFQPWGGISPINYRFRPYGNDPDACIMDVMFLADFEGERPPPAAVTHLGFDDDWTIAEELGSLAMVFNQDTGNLPRVQRGLHATQKPGATLGNYQEARIRQFHDELGRWIPAS